MAEDSRDILMTMVPGTSTMSTSAGLGPIPAECQALVSPDDTLAVGAGFAMITKSGRGSPSPNYFAIDDFTFEVALKDAATKEAKEQSDAIKGVQDQNKKLQDAAVKLNPELGKALGMSAGGSSSEFNRFILNGQAGLKNGNNKSFVGDLGEITITKRMDVSSPTLMGYCLGRQQFTSATLIKRRATGADQLRTFFMIQFNQLMLTSFDWADDDVVKETFKFVCRQAIVTYAVEDYNGTLLVQPTAKWEVPKFTPSSS
jgi:type VI protein secretion system component Hcp